VPLGATTHPVDEVLPGDAVRLEDLRGEVQVNGIRQNSQGLFGEFGLTCPAQHVDYAMPGSLHRAASFLLRDTSLLGTGQEGASASPLDCVTVSAAGHPHTDCIPSPAAPPGTTAAPPTPPGRRGPRRYRTSLAEGELVVDPALGVGQGLAGAAPAELDQLSCDGYGRLLGRPGPEVQADR